LAVEGAATRAAWIEQVLEGSTDDEALRKQCVTLLDMLCTSSYRQLAERQSTFTLLLPDDSESTEVRTDALARWCEGFLHGLVSGKPDEAVRKQLASEPLAEVIKDLLQITRAVADSEEGEESNESAYAELVEYVRVAAQLTFEELAALRLGPAPDDDSPGNLH
jgi:uncharacterized protein YgfB (UPF0149 family)